MAERYQYITWRPGITNDKWNRVVKQVLLAV